MGTATYSESAATGCCHDTRFQYHQFQARLLQRCSLWNTELNNPEATEGAELSRSCRIATVEVLSCTTSTEIIALASNYPTH